MRNCVSKKKRFSDITRSRNVLTLESFNRVGTSGYRGARFVLPTEKKIKLPKTQHF